MKILSKYSADVRSRNRQVGGYEWWYFDAMSDDQRYSIVVILYEGNPFSTRYNQRLLDGQEPQPEEHPAISISIYDYDTPIYYSFTEFEADDCCFSEDSPAVRVGSHTMSSTAQDGRIRYTLELDEQLPNGEGIQAELGFESEQSGIFAESDEQGKGHCWNLIQPRAAVTGNIILLSDGQKKNEIAFQGTGYHDHNTGQEPMRDEFTDWYWGRFHFDYGTLVYYVMNRQQTQQHNAWLISADNSSLLRSFENIDLADRGFTLFGLKTARKVGLRTNQVEAQVQQSGLIDNGPFYQRYRSEAFLRVPSEGVIESTKGISEYIHPNRIYARMFWPFVDMRIRYQAEGTHWVQRSKMLYRWTW